MKKALIFTFILSCLIVVVGCSNEKKPDSSSGLSSALSSYTAPEENDPLDNDYENTEFEDGGVVEEKYRGDFVFYDSELSEKLLRIDDVSAASCQTFFLPEDTQVFWDERANWVYTIGNELMTCGDETGSPWYKWGTFTDVNTLVIDNGAAQRANIKAIIDLYSSLGMEIASELKDINVEEDLVTYKRR